MKDLHLAFIRPINPAKDLYQGFFPTILRVVNKIYMFFVSSTDFLSILISSLDFVLLVSFKNQSVYGRNVLTLF
jgi:hypothetical protein